MTAYFQLTEPSQTDTEHTPGKWKARELFAHDEPEQSMGLFIYTEKNSRGSNPDPIASLPGISREDFANAQLIAAAPELLAALESLLEFMPIVANSPFGRANNVQAYIDDARAALAKARGANASGK